MNQPKAMSPTRAEMDAMMAEIAAANAAAIAAKAEAAEAKRIASETHDMVQEIHTHLMQVQPGQARSLLDRMAAVTIDIESGKRAGQIVLGLVGFALAMAAVLKWGHVPTSKG